MKTNGKKPRNPQSELDPNEATLRIVDLRHMLGQEIIRAKQDAEQKVRERFAAKEKAIIERVSPGYQVTVEKRAAYLLAEENCESVAEELDG